MEPERKNPAKMPGSSVSFDAETALADDLQVDRLRSFAAAIRLGVEGDFLVLRQTAQAGSLHGRNMYEDVRATVLRLDETKALIGIEEFYSASLGHASGPFHSPDLRAALQFCPVWAWGQFSTIEERVLVIATSRRKEKQPPPLAARSGLRLRPAFISRSSRVRRLPEHSKSDGFILNWQAKLF
ncbi:conserved hypothetical protein [Sinorhizobium medicae]|uniref:Uncharacterized protein n=1 Tax=Sinorhizobium medicae TaxID=110321 RepID=A0A508WUX1_9HYPH|nr:conserved hypothetical protein [Sinorhizobium medicae]